MSMNTPVTGNRLARWMVLGFAAGGLALTTVGCRPAESGNSPVEAALLGRWIQVYPQRGALDTMVLGSAGRVVYGRHIASDTSDEPARWSIGTPLMPDGLCLAGDSVVGQTSHWTCQAYVISHDTLWLANGEQSTFLRLMDSTTAAPIQPWASPRRVVNAKELKSDITPRVRHNERRPDGR